MRISIIVPALNEEKKIAETVSALQRLEGETEIIVVDGGSTDGTVESARRCGVTVLAAARGRGPQMHAGALAATGDVFWFVHADTLPPPSALADIETALADPAVAGGNFGLLFDGPSKAARQLTFIYPFLRYLGLSYGDSAIFVRRDRYSRIGGFRPLALFEDLDLLRRLKKTGRFVHLLPCMITSSRRFEQRSFAFVWSQWTMLQILYWFRVPPNWLARLYRHIR